MTFEMYTDNNQIQDMTVAPPAIKDISFYNTKVMTFKMSMANPQSHDIPTINPIYPHYKYSRTSLSRTRLFRNTAYLEVKTWSLF